MNMPRLETSHWFEEEAHLQVTVFVRGLACLCAILVVLSTVLAMASDQPVTAEDIVAATKHSESLLRDYRVRYRTTKRWLWKGVYSQSNVGLGKTRPKLLRLERKTEEEMQKSMVSQYTWGAKGTKFFYERDFQDDINNLAHKEKHAFDNKRHVQLNDHHNVLSGVIERPGAAYRAMPTDVITPASFFAELMNWPIVNWLGQASVTVAPKMETVAGTNCYVVECAGKDGAPRAKFWFSPAFGLRPMRMECHLPNGQYCSYLVTEMKEVAEGLWLPMKGTEEWHVYPPGKKSLVLYSVAEFEADPTSVRVNQGIDDQEFTFKFPAGTKVHDRITNLAYVVGDAEATSALMDHFLDAIEDIDQRTTVELKRPQKTSSMPAPDVQGQSDQRDETESPGAENTQGTGWGPIWLVAAIAVCAVLICGFIVYRKKRSG